MQTTTPYIEVHVPYAFRHLNSEIKRRSGFFSSETKLWNLPDTGENRAFAAQFQTPRKANATPEERIKAVAETCTELLTALRVGQFRLTECSPKRIVIEGVVQG